MGNSVAGKIALGAMLLVLAAVSATGYVAIARQTEAMERAEETSADLLATAVVVTCAADIFRNDMANLSHTVRRMREHNPALLAVVIRDRDGRALASSSAEAGAVAGGMKVERPVSLYGQDYGTLDLVFSTENRDRARREILETTTGVTAVLLIISFLGALGWAAYFARPIVALAKAAEAVAGGDLATRVSVSRSDEIGRLADRFNGMVESLARSRADLERTLNELSTLYSVSRVINTTSDREEILRLNLETLGTGFSFSSVAILLEVDHAWRLVALRSEGATLSRAETVDSLARAGLAEAAEADGAVKIRPLDLPESWRFAPDSPAFAVPLRTGSHLVGLLVAGGPGALAPDADRVLGVVASQIAPPILISLMSERESQKLTNPFAFIFARLETALAKSASFSLGLTVLSFRAERRLWSENATEAERGFEGVIDALRQRLTDADLIVRYGLDRVLVVMPSWSKADARKALMTLDLPGIDELEVSIASFPEDGRSAPELLASLERA